LAVGGVIAMLIGALMLIRSPMTGAGVSLGVALGVTAPFAAVTIVLMRLVLRSRRWKQSTGPEQLVGAAAEVTEAIDVEASPTAPASAVSQVQSEEKLFQGMVRLRGELWRAVATQPVPAGTRVRVLRIAGLTAYVAPADGSSTQGARGARGHQDAA
jgi:membrane-bound serine protease (ClpP class)